MAPLVRRSWAPVGKTPIIRQRARSHQKVSAIAAIATSSAGRKARLLFALHPGKSINAPRVLNFLRQLNRQIQGRFIIVWDRLNTHRAKIVMQWFAFTKRATVEYLPPYAPELNPVEYAWGYLKINPLSNRPEMEVTSLTQSTRHQTRSIQRMPTLLRSFLNHSTLFSPK
jgi:transposase